MTAGTYAAPVAWGQGTLPYACDDCRKPAVAVRPGGVLPDNDNAPDHAWCATCWLRHWGEVAA